MFWMTLSELMDKKEKEEFELIKKVLSLIPVFGSIAGFFTQIVQPSANYPNLSSFDRFNIIIHLSILTAIFYGIIWTTIEKIFKWKYGAGGHGLLPRGFSSIMLSLSLLIPALTIPYFYEKLVNVKILPPNHLKTGIIVILFNSFIHLLLYGTDSKYFLGIRHIIYSLKAPLIRIHLIDEFVHSILNIGLTVVVYKIFITPNFTFSDTTITLKIIFSALIVFFGVAGYIILKYPDSLEEETWIQVRGVIAGMFMSLAFCGGMYL